MEKENKTVKGYKGFDKNLRCRDFQYEIGKEYETERAELCREGFHFCENPHDVLNYYSAGEGNRFAVVEASEVSDEKEDDSKRVSKRISVKAEISVFEICRIAVSAFFENFGFKKKIESADTNNAGDYGAANAGDRGAAIDKYGYKGEYFFYCILLDDFKESFSRVNHWRSKGGRFLPHAQPYRDVNNPHHIVPQWQKDLAGWADKKQVFRTCEFKDFEPRKGFRCRQYFDNL